MMGGGENLGFLRKVREGFELPGEGFGASGGRDLVGGVVEKGGGCMRGRVQRSSENEGKKVKPHIRLGLTKGKLTSSAKKLIE